MVRPLRHQVSGPARAEAAVEESANKLTVTDRDEEAWPHDRGRGADAARMNCSNAGCWGSLRRRRPAWRLRRGHRLIDPDAGQGHDSRPFVAFLDDKRTEILWRPAQRLGPELGQLRLDIR